MRSFQPDHVMIKKKKNSGGGGGTNSDIWSDQISGKYRSDGELFQ